MSTSLLYHAFGLRGYRYCKSDYVAGEVVFTIDQKRQAYRCPICESANVEARGSVTRVFQTVPIGTKPTFIRFAIPKVKCHDCGAWRQQKLGFAEPRRRHTRTFGRMVLELSRLMTIQDVANHLRVGWDRVKEIQKHHLQRKYAKPKLKHLRKIAIDEIHVGNGRGYLTLVLDLDTGAVVFVGEGKDANALKPFWRRLRASGAKIEAVATDMSKAYIAAVREALPEAAHVFDRFHVVALFNEKLTQLRRKLYRELTDKLDKDVLKGIRWLLLKHPDKLDDSRNEYQRLHEALKLNQPLAMAYYLKEDLRQFWEQPDREAADNFLNAWIRRADASGVSLLRRFANTMAMYRVGLLNYYDYPISTGPLEGTNNKIKTMKRQAYGYRDQEFFKLKILSAHQMKFTLVG